MRDMSNPNPSKFPVLASAAKSFRAFVTGDHPCPDCGSDDAHHEDNGLAPTAYGYTILCLAPVPGKGPCGMQWSPNEG